VSERHKIYCLWRPYLCDATGDRVLALAVAAQCDFIVAHHRADFKLRTQGALRVMSPQQFLQSLKERK
jgi:predicted nucleic acid-binding protein